MGIPDISVDSVFISLLLSGLSELCLFFRQHWQENFQNLRLDKITTNQEAATHTAVVMIVMMRIPVERDHPGVTLLDLSMESPTRNLM